MRRNWIISAAALTLVSGTALAQPAKRQQKQDDNTVLRGPDVKRGPAQGDRPQDGRRDGRRDGQRPQVGPEGAGGEQSPFLAHMLAIRSLERSSDSSLKLSEEQKTELKAIAEERRIDLEGFMEAHRDELKALRDKAGVPERGEPGEPGQRARRQRDGEGPRGDRAGDRGPGRDGGGAPPDDMDGPMDDEMMDPMSDGPDGRGGPGGPEGRPGPDGPRERPTPEQMEARKQLRDMMASAVDDTGYVARVNEVLTDAQRKQVEATIAKGRERIARLREGQRGQPGAAREQRAPQERRQRGDRP